MKSFARPRGMEPSERTVASRLFPFARNFFFFFLRLLLSNFSPQFLRLFTYRAFRTSITFKRRTRIDENIFHRRFFSSLVAKVCYVFYLYLLSYDRCFRTDPIRSNFRKINERTRLVGSESLELACRKSESRDLEFMNEKAYATARTSSWHASPPLKVNPVGVVIVGTRGINVTNSGTVVT